MVDSSNLYETWQLVCAQVKGYDSVNPVQVDAFFSRLQPQAISDGFLIVTADTAFIKSQVERRFMTTIQQALKDLFGIDYLVEIEVDPTEGAAAPSNSAPAATGAACAAPQPMPSMPAPSQAMPPFAAAPATVQMPANPQVVAAPQPAQVQAQRPDTTQPIPVIAPAPAEETVAEPRENVIFPTTAGEETEFVEHVLPSDSRTRHPRTPVNDTALLASSLTFETFVVGDSNRLAYSMAVAVAEEPGKKNLNPLFIYGRSGLGKTHLLRAIQNYIITTNPQMRVVYIDSSEFLSDYTAAVVAHDKEKDSYLNFQNRYVNADVLLIDDVQKFQGKSATVDIVFQLFNKLTDMGKQVVLAADRAPKTIDIDERYTSRFNSGGTCDIQPPEIETKAAIIRGFIDEYRSSENAYDLYVPEEIQTYIAEISSSNVRELKSAVTKVISQITYFNNPDISLPDVRVLLENHFMSGATKRLDVASIQKEVERYYKISHADLVGKKRSRNIAYARQVAMYLCRQMLDIPYNDIGKRFDRDHSSVMYSVGQVEDKLTKSRELQEEIELIIKNIREN
ncbi:MAG: chromosomal replication initiator protein DnaA [Slackia sp.]|nr:chromosomal replication initiator protein DnaA [Slackia sp.]